MRVIFPRIETLHYHKAYDGGSKYVHYLSEKLVKKGVNVTIVTTQLRENPNLKKTNYKGVRYVFLPPKYIGKRLIPFNALYKFLFSWNLKKYLEKIDFDVLHSAEAFAWWYLHKRNRKPVIIQSFGLEPFYGPESLSQKGLKKIYVKLFLQNPWRYCLKRSEKVASEGDFHIQFIEKLGVKKNQIFSLPNALDIASINKIERSYVNKKQELGMKKRDLIILSVCQIAPDKGIDDIINGFTMLKREIPNAKLIMIGKGILESMMHELFKKNKLIEEKDVFHRKNVPEDVLYDYYFSSDIFVTASIQSDLVLCAQEAMACGLPIVSAGQPMLVENGVNGYIVGPKNPKGIAKGILKIYKSSRKGMKKMGEESKKMVKQYDYDNIADMAIKEYKKLLRY